MRGSATLAAMKINAHARPAVVLLAISLAAFLAIIDGTVVALMLPAMGHELRVKRIDLTWIPNVYVLTYASLLATAGVLGDRFGRKPVFVMGIGLFAAGSVICATAGSLGWLLAGRMVQGAGGAAMLTLALAQIALAFPDRREWAMGILVATGSLGGLLGPALGGVLTQAAGWRQVFWLLAAAAMMAMALASTALQDSRGSKRGFDPIGLLLLGLTAATLNLVLIDGPSFVLLAICASAAAALVAWESHHRDPIISLRDFGDHVLVGNTLASATGWFAIFAVDVYASLYLQSSLGLTAMAAGVALAAAGATCALAGPTVERAVGRFGAVRLLCFSTMAMGLLLVPWIWVSAAWPYWSVVVLLAVWGLPMSYVLSLSSAGALAAVSGGRAGAGAATFNTFRQIGSSLGIALPAAALSFSGSFASAFAVRAVVCVVAAAAVGASLLRPALHRSPTPALDLGR